MNNNFQRSGSVSNAHVGREFESIAFAFFASKGLSLSKDFAIPLGVTSVKKPHKFDLGSNEPPVLVECKSHKWTKSDKTPSAKLTVWNEAMYYFQLAPSRYRKIMFVLRDFSAQRQVSLAEFYLRNHGHLIPEDVEFWEYDPSSERAMSIR
ncbi:MAG: hypothetical protein ACTSUY_09435 [Alphaproteobacteria bacterium]